MFEDDIYFRANAKPFNIERTKYFESEKVKLIIESTYKQFHFDDPQKEAEERVFKLKNRKILFRQLNKALNFIWGLLDKKYKKNLPYLPDKFVQNYILRKTAARAYDDLQIRGTIHLFLYMTFKNMRDIVNFIKLPIL